jgi:hypothetical protein
VCGKQQGCGGVSSMHISIAFDFLCLANWKKNTSKVSDFHLMTPSKPGSKIKWRKDFYTKTTELHVPKKCKLSLWINLICTQSITRFILVCTEVWQKVYKISKKILRNHLQYPGTHVRITLQWF